MSEIQYFRDRVKEVLVSAYGKIGDFVSKENWDSASQCMDKELENKSIEDKTCIIKHVSIEPEDHLKALADMERHSKIKYSPSDTAPRELIEGLCKYTSVEMMPKIDISEKSMNFLSTLHFVHRAIGSLGQYWTDPLTVSRLTEEIYYRNKALINFPFQKIGQAKPPVGFLILAEGQKGREFTGKYSYPKFKEYVAPSLLFDLYENTDYHLKVLNRFYHDFKNL